MSWIPMIKIGDEWVGNSQRFATKAEAISAADRIMRRWIMQVTRADESTDAVNSGPYMILADEV
jgi:hypothetical protein